MRSSIIYSADGRSLWNSVECSSHFQSVAGTQPGVDGMNNKSVESSAFIGYTDQMEYS